MTMMIVVVEGDRRVVVVDTGEAEAVMEEVGAMEAEAVTAEAAAMGMEEEGVTADMTILVARINYYRFCWWDCWVCWPFSSTSDRPRLRVGVAWMKTISLMVNL
jgi:hypothetical protein